jgi:MFS transporter, NNP family, nitrate/nitrite transporter
MLDAESQTPAAPQFRHQADRIELFNFRTPPMRAFHCTWIAFFTCFFAWFGLAPLMPLIREELRLEPWQVGNLIVASVAATILARLIIGPLCDRFGPRLTYSWLLGLCSLPVMGVGLANNYETLLLFRFAIGAIGASFVVTQFHTSIMFSKKCVGAANAAAAGWGNLGGGVTQQVMPLLVAGIVAMGVSTFWAWRGAMFLAGLACLAAGIAYYFLTQDAPDGNFRELRAAGKLPRRKTELAGFWLACRDPRVWALFVAYGASFGIELTMDNVAATYFFDHFDLSAASAGFIAGLFGAMNLFARFLGGWLADRFGNRGGLAARIGWLAAVLLGEGIMLVLFGGISSVAIAIPALLVMGLFVKMANGAAYAVVPLIHRGNLGAVAGIVGAGGNVGAVLAGFLFRAPSDQWPGVLQTLGVGVLVCSLIPLAMAIGQRAAMRPVEENSAIEPAL